MSHLKNNCFRLRDPAMQTETNLLHYPVWWDSYATGLNRDLLLTNYGGMAPLIWAKWINPWN
jgi:hypothetical protein